MLIGIVGAPNKGKSTFFSSATMIDVAIADYAFTTIEPNVGVAYYRTKCAHVELGLSGCNARNSVCENGSRLAPIKVLDVAGLVPGASTGRGLGNKFLDDLRQADALIQVIDCSGKTDLEGKPSEDSNVCEEVKFLEKELDEWMFGIVDKNAKKHRGKSLKNFAEDLSGLNVRYQLVLSCIEKLGLEQDTLKWTENNVRDLAVEIRKASKPIAIAANKADKPESKANLEKLKQEFPGKIIVPTLSVAEMALRKATKAGIIKYTPGDKSFEVVNMPIDEAKRKGLETLKHQIERNEGTGVQELLNKVVEELLKQKTAYPVEDEHKYSDSKGMVLPDVFLISPPYSPLQLAEKVHSDLAKHFLYATDCKRHMRISKDAELKNGDVIKIVASK